MPDTIDCSAATTKSRRPTGTGLPATRADLPGAIRPYQGPTDSSEEAKSQWDSRSRGAWKHLRERAEQPKITVEQLIQLDAWKQSDPDVPDGDWYKGFGGFKICCRGAVPTTILEGNGRVR